MREENNTPKNKWSQIFKKKWFFPALYLTVAALLLTTAVWYQNKDEQAQKADKDKDYAQNIPEEEAKSVLDPQELIRMPVADEKQTEIVTKFYDYNADEKDQKDGIILYNNRYYQSTGVSIGSADGETFDVVAALGGTVKEVKEDPLLGNVVVMDHENDVSTYYASLGEVKAKAGDELQQGDVIGTSGKNLFMKDNGIHVHFELRKDGQSVNPESFFNQPLSKLESVKLEDKADQVKEDSKDDALKEMDDTKDEGTADEPEENGTTAEPEKAEKNTQNG